MAIGGTVAVTSPTAPSHMSPRDHDLPGHRILPEPQVLDEASEVMADSFRPQRGT